MFVGRRDELEVLADALRLSAEGRLRLVLVEGEAGIGKTRLVTRAVADRTDGVVLWATAAAAERDVAFGVLDQPLRNHDGAARLGLGQHADAVAAGVALVDLLGSLSGGLVAIVVDDAPWMDVPASQALLFALRRLRMDPVTVFLTARSEEVDRLSRAAHQLVSSHGRRLALGGLDRGELGLLAEGLTDRSLPVMALDRLLEYSRGNPLLATALLEELPEDVWWVPADTPLPASRSFAALVLGRLARCGEHARALIIAAATLGPQGGLADAFSVAALDDPLAAFEEAVAAGFLATTETPVGTRFSFTHPLVHAAVSHDIAATTAERLHRRAAAIVADEWERLRHLAAAAQEPDLALAETLRSFARGQLTGGPAQAGMAAAAYQAAARLVGDRAVREDLLLRALQCLLLVGDVAQAELLAELLPGFLGSARRSYLCGWFALVTGAWEEADAHLLSAWDVSTREGDHALAAAVATHVAATRINRTDQLDEAAEWARRALARLSADSPEPTAGSAPAERPTLTEAGLSHALLPMALAATGRWGDALDGVPAIPVSGPLLPEHCHALLGRGIVRLWRGHLASARADLARAVAETRRLGLFTTSDVGLLYLAEAEFRSGAWDDALLHSQLAVSTADDAEQTWMMGLAHANAVLPLAWRGRWQAADVHVRQALAGAGLLPHDANIIWAHTARATLAAARHDHAEVIEATDEVEAAFKGLVAPGIKPWWVLRGEALVAHDRSEEAEELISPFGAEAVEGASDWALQACARVRAMAAARRGQTDRAADRFDAGLARARACGDPFQRARLQLAYGAFLRRAGRRRAAQDLLRGAERTFALLRAAPELREAERELVGCGLAPRRRSDDARLQLTPQEETVAHLVVEGLRNREIADALVVSIKTVEYHLGNVYRKVGVANRTQLVARLTSPERTRPRPGSSPGRADLPLGSRRRAALATGEDHAGS